MESQIAPDVDAPSINPFPATAVARLSPLDSDSPSIQTSAVRQAMSFLSDYLKRSDQSDRREDSETGSTIAIVGEYGTGKTHIALAILKRLQLENDATLHSFYLDAPADTFLALYKERFVLKLTRREVRNRVEEYLTEILAAELQESSMTAPAAERLLAGEATPLELMKNLGLSQTDLMRRLRERLRRVTERDDFALAFSLFLRPEFEDAVWEWIRANPPDPVLQERGITRTIDTDPAALEAIGVLAFLFGRRGHRFALIVDEMEKVFTRSGGRATDEATILAFKKLMEAISKTHALLVLIGLPDFLESIPDDARQRLSATIRPSPLTSDETVHYIREAQRRVLGRERLKPFTRDSAAYIAEITGGNARRVVRLCYHAYLASSESGSEVTRAMLREVAREQFEHVTQEDAATEIIRCFDSNGWLFEQEKLLGPSTSSKVDFWLPVGENGWGCIIELTRSLLHQNDVEKVVAPIKGITDAIEEDKRIASLLVVNGYLAENLVEAVDAAFDRHVIFKARGFREDFEAAIKGLRQRLEEATREDVLAFLRERVDQLARQSSFVADQTEQLLQITVDAPTVESAVVRGIRLTFGQLGRSDSSGLPDSRFRQLSEFFDLNEQRARSFEELASRMLGSTDARALDLLDKLDPIAFSTAVVAMASASTIRMFLKALTQALETVSPRTMDEEVLDSITPACRLYDRVSRLLHNQAEHLEDPKDPATLETKVQVVNYVSSLDDLGYQGYTALRDDLFGGRSSRKRST